MPGWAPASMRAGRRLRHSSAIQSTTPRSVGWRGRESTRLWPAHPGPGGAATAGERLGLPVGRPSARGPAAADGALRRRVSGRPGHRGRRSGWRHAGPAAGPHRYPHTAHPIAGGADVAREGARRLGIEMRVGPVGITNGAFGNRPHCIYRGFCLQACKVNAKASPLVTHIPDAIAHGAEIREHCMASRLEVDDSSGRVTGVRYLRDGEERFQRADAVAIAGYSIETPRLLLNSSSRRFPHGIGNSNDQMGRCVMVQGAPQVAARFPEELRMYKAPPPELSSEQFYETDETRGFARGFSIQTVGPLPIGWPE